MLAKTAQKHDYPSAAWRRSYARRSGAERGFATAKDPASNTISRGRCRLMSLAPLMLFTTVLLAARNHRILAAWNARQEENTHRAAKGLPPRTRKHRRSTPAAPATAAAPPYSRHAHATITSSTTTARREHAPNTPDEHRATKKDACNAREPSHLERDHHPAPNLRPNVKIAH